LPATPAPSATATCPARTSSTRRAARQHWQ
jgi:hypothetical protein